MGCFCQREVAALCEAPADDRPASEPSEAAELVTAAANWLAQRWLPSTPWEPDPAWLDDELPDPPMPPEAFAVLTSLVQTYQALTAQLDIDPTAPEQLRPLTRIIGTLNRRLPALAELASDPRPWQEVAARNDAADTVREAVAQHVFDDQEPEPPLTPWRPLIAKVRGLAPLLAIGQMLDLDLTDEAAPDLLRAKIRDLRQVKLPPLDDPGVVLRLIAKSQAVTRLQRSLGADPRKHAFERVEAAVERRVQAAAAALPQTLGVLDGQLRGAQPRQANPAMLVTDDVVRRLHIPPQTLDRLRWQAPPFDQLDLLTTGAPVAALVGCLRLLGPSPVRTSPCGQNCDAGTVARALERAG